MTIGVVTVAYGDKYRAFLPSWIQAITMLERKPDKITVVTDNVSSAMASLGNIQLSNATFRQAHNTFTVHPQVLVNEAIDSTHTDWICKMDVDDLIYPHALNNLDTCEADVYMFGIMHQNHRLPARKVSGELILNTMHNLVFSCSPFKRWVWEAAPYRDILCEDWAFWIDASKNGATFEASPTIDYEYVMHGDNISLRGDFPAYETMVRESNDRRGDRR